MVSEQLLVTVSEAAKMLGLGRSATYQLIQRGTLPSVKIGGSRRVVVADLHEFIQRLKEEANEAF